MKEGENRNATAARNVVAINPADFRIGVVYYNPGEKSRTIQRLQFSIDELLGQGYHRTNERIKKLEKRIRKLNS